MLPLYLAWWLWTEYLPMDCKTTQDLLKPRLTNCYYPTLDHAPVMMFLLAVTGSLLLALVLILDVLLPLRRGGRLRTSLGTTVLIPVPFVIGLFLT
ncbi:hypothetical protein [Actinomadura sp. SCN-SB]|uniref:hypothetical protein n=1 Tax=Actinomadura sp. SCN-SB TaxID=3373092 RepID=UPI0037515086